MKLFFALAVSLVFIGCKKTSTPAKYVPRDVREVSLENDADIVKYLKTHFYNYKDFETPPADFNYTIFLDTIAGNNSDKTPLINQVNVLEVMFASVPHKLYYLSVREGTGTKPAVVDSVFVRYEGRLLNGRIFDNRVVPVWMDLSTGVTGYRTALSKLKSGTKENIGFKSDGSYELPKNGGVGFVVMPSGLGYFDGVRGIVPSYSPMIFTYSSYLSKVTDQDADTLKSIDEDVDKDGNPLNDDTDRDGVPNFLDADDDNDGVPTKKEYDNNPDDPLVPDDRDRDGIPDYLDNN